MVVELVETVGAVGAIAWAAIALRAAWLLPDWLTKWQRLLEARRARADEEEPSPDGGSSHS